MGTETPKVETLTDIYLAVQNVRSETFVVMSYKSSKNTIRFGDVLMPLFLSIGNYRHSG